MKTLTAMSIVLIAGLSMAGCDRASTQSSGENRASTRTSGGDSASTQTSGTNSASQTSTTSQQQSPPIVQSPTAETATTSDMAQRSRVFEVLDQDRDGYVSKLEGSDHVESYTEADTNNDGRLDRQEFATVELKDIDGE